jgi:hypothetical protein
MPINFYSTLHINQLYKMKNSSRHNLLCQKIAFIIFLPLGFFNAKGQDECHLTWVFKNCYEVEFTATFDIPMAGIYRFDWDFDCGGPLPVQTVTTASNTNTISYTFPCGGGLQNICLLMEDPTGLQCSFMQMINVPDNCCGNGSGTTACTPTPNMYAFSITYNDPPGVGSCSYSILSSSGTIQPLSLIYTPNSAPPGVTVSGLIAVPNVIPLNLNFTMQSNCICMATGLPTTCNLPISVQTQCCKEIGLDDHFICREALTKTIPINITTWPPLSNITSVNWYAIAKPATGICPAPPFPLIQSTVTNTLDPLKLYPVSLQTDLCVYAEVKLDDGPCQLLTTNVAMVTRCSPETCTLNNYDYCYMGTCIVPGPLTLSVSNLPDACPYTIEWFEPGNPNPVQTGGLTYQPTICLNMSNTQNCYEDFLFTVKITDDCGQRNCQATVRLYSDFADAGLITIDPTEPQYFCPQEDATLKYTPGCAGNPPTWTWLSTNQCIGGTPLPVPGAGTKNTLLNTNKMGTSVVYSVMSQNGVCPPDIVSLTLEVKDPLTMTSFSGISDPCAEQFVTLDLDFLPCNISGCNTPCNCTYTVDWYKDGFYLATSTATPPMVSFTNTVSPLVGNYSAVLKSDCCDEEVASPVVSFQTACEPVIIGQCFICDNKPVDMMVEMVIPPSNPCPNFCTYIWSFLDPALGWVQIGTGSMVTLTVGGTYMLTSDCNGCIKSVQFNLLPCQSVSPNPPFSCGPVSVEELLTGENNPVRIFPNPTTGEINIEWLDRIPENGRLYITDPLGQVLQTKSIPDYESTFATSLDDLPAGMYYLKVRADEHLWTVAKLIKE